MVDLVKSDEKITEKACVPCEGSALVTNAKKMSLKIEASSYIGSPTP